MSRLSQDILKYVMFSFGILQFLEVIKYEDSSLVRFSRTDPMVSGSNQPSAKLSLRIWQSLALCNSRRGNHEAWSHREKGSENCLISKRLLSVHWKYIKN